MRNHRSRLAIVNLTQNHSAVIPAALLLACVFASGCSRRSGLERASIRGEVTLDGNPVSSGSIRLVPLEKNGGPSSGGDIVDGKYDIHREKGPTLGSHRVEVYVPYNTGRKIPSPMGGAVTIAETDPSKPPTGTPATNQNQAGMVDAWGDKAPLKYNRESTLEVNIESGNNVFDVHMESK